MVSGNDDHQSSGSSTLAAFGYEPADFGCGLRNGGRNPVVVVYIWPRGRPGSINAGAGILSAAKGYSLTCGSVDGLPFASHSFDLVTSFDVLYSRSVPDVHAALEEINRVLSPGGHLLLRLPAYDWLRGRHDEAVHTARQFTVKGIKGLLHCAGFTVLHSSYANTFLFPFALGKRLAEHAQPKRTSASDLTIRFGLLNQFFLYALEP